MYKSGEAFLGTLCCPVLPHGGCPAPGAWPAAPGTALSGAAEIVVFFGCHQGRFVLHTKWIHMDTIWIHIDTICVAKGCQGMPRHAKACQGMPWHALACHLYFQAAN